jgi:hypothetical protein
MADLERVRRTCASFFEPSLVPPLQTAFGKAETSNALHDATEQRRDQQQCRHATPRPDRTPSYVGCTTSSHRRPARPRCAIDCPVEPMHGDAKRHASVATPAGRWGGARPPTPRHGTRPLLQSGPGPADSLECHVGVPRGLRPRSLPCRGNLRWKARARKRGSLNGLVGSTTSAGRCWRIVVQVLEGDAAAR